MKKNNNNGKTIFLAIVAVIFIGALVGGGTYAYWIWQTNESQRTSVTFTISKPNFTITGDNLSSNTLAPTASCYYTNANYSQHTLAGRATVTAENNTSASMRATITLKGSLTPVSGRTLPTSGSNSAANIHWAIKEVASATTGFAAGNCTGTAGSTYATGTFSGKTANGTYSDIPTSISFDVAPGATGTKYYQVYVWIDSAYTHTNYGSTNDDPMQGLTVALTFSETSIFTQELSQTVYTVAADDTYLFQPIANGITQYTSASSAMTNFGHPVALKHKIGNYSGWCIIMNNDTTNCLYGAPSESVCNEVLSQGAPDDGNTYTCSNITLNNVVTESHVVFEVTPTMASANSGMTAGTYELRGGDNGASYSTNVSTLTTAFGLSNCTDNTSDFGCSVSGLGASANDSGYVDAGGTDWYCGVDDDGGSYCYE